MKMLRVLPHIPNKAGVYFFKQNRRPLYIGKAVSLKKRLGSYFRKNAGWKVSSLLAEATKVDWIETQSEAEALIKEAELIKKHRPKFNYMLRDDKSYFYVVFTREEFPRLLVVHKTALDPVRSHPDCSRDDGAHARRTSNGIHGKKYKWIIGPFTSGSMLRITLKLLRRTFPYCTCKERHKRPCLNAQIGRCLGYCCLNLTTKVYPTIVGRTLVERKSYTKNIASVAAILSGKRTRLLSRLKREMQSASKAQDYERAAGIRDQIGGIENVFHHKSLFGVELQRGALWRRSELIIRQLVGARERIKRVEGYDISNISGASATGSMVVFIDGEPTKSEYRKFRIKTVHQASDTDMLKEVIRRRLGHTGWPYPQLMLIDGGKAQLNAAIAALKFQVSSFKFKAPKMAALAKREEELYIKGRMKPVRLDSLPAEVMHFFQRVRDESHRFAKKYHHKLREIAYRQI